MEIARVNSDSTIHLAKNKISSLDNISTIVQSKCIFTKGVFDLLHYGHLSLFAYIEQLKQETGCIFVVGVTSDRMVKSKKGINRPINPESERAMQIALLPQVDFVFINDEEDLSPVIDKLQPNIFVKGMDTAGKIDDLSVMVESNPEFNLLSPESKIIIYCDNGEISTSTIINRIKS